MPNRLENEGSPYLLQHANNPVDWYPWGEEALQKARVEDKPIFLSIGYAACHWCHVMAHETFEDPEVADLLNAHFVSIKVDREERPDIDSIFMSAVVAMSGQGGWPTSVFLTPDGRPFYGGTYFPPTRRHNLPAFRDVLNSIIQTWQGDRKEINNVATRLTQYLQEHSGWVAAASQPGISGQTLTDVAKSIRAAYDWQYGGWGKAPKFPQPMVIEFLLRQATRGEDGALKTAVHALDSMVRGGMYDVIGGGFHRYSTDSIWLIPHFEKMLYDNAQLALVYLHAYLLTSDEEYLRTCTETLNFMMREMHDVNGGFYSSLDADVEGEEGTFYLWTPEQVAEALPDPKDRTIFKTIYPISKMGNFEGKNVIQRTKPWAELSLELGAPVEELRQRMDPIKQALLAARQERLAPGVDDKVLVSWNALALQAFAEAGRYLGRSDYLLVAQENADFLLNYLHLDGQLKRSFRAGVARHSAYLEDYGALIVALLALYQADSDSRWYQAAIHLSEEMISGYQDPAGGFFDTHSGKANLLLRPKDVQDNATPSGNALAANALLILSLFDEQKVDLQDQVEMVLNSLSQTILQYPTAFAYWLQVMDLKIGPTRQIAILLPDESEMVAPYMNLVQQSYRPRSVVAASVYPPDENAPHLLADRQPQDGKPTIYICEEFTCLRPLNDLTQLQVELEFT